MMKLFFLLTSCAAFAPVPHVRSTAARPRSILFAEEEYTVKQRLREEIDSPFRKVRVVFFGASAASALIALYFSLLTLGKVAAGFPDVPTTKVAVTDVGINIAGVAVCAYLTNRDIRAGQANLERIAKGGQMASLRVAPADGSNMLSLGQYRQSKRVLIAAGGVEYQKTLAASMPDVADDLDRVNVIVVPALLKDGEVDVAETRSIWSETPPFPVLAFPALGQPWTDYLSKEIETAKSQKIDPEVKGLGIYLKKNGRILRRATGQPDWATFVGTMEVMDGSQFGSPKF